MLAINLFIDVYIRSGARKGQKIQFQKFENAAKNPFGKCIRDYPLFSHGESTFNKR